MSIAKQLSDLKVKYSKSNKSQSLIVFLAIYFLIWSIVPAFISSSVPLDVSEGINWGSEWQWGYYKHPPFSSWVLYSFYKVFGHIGPYLLSQLYVLITLLLIYKLGRKLFSVPQAFLGAVLTLAIFYYNYPTLEFNHNIAQFPIWAGLYLLFYQCITTNRYKHWILFGIVGGLGMLTKYSVVFLLIPMAIYLLLPNQWRLLKQPKPWVAAGIMLIIFAPHLVWLIQNDWLPFSYASDRSSESVQNSGIAAHFSWFSFSLSQLVAHIPLLIMLFLSRKHLDFQQLPNIRLTQLRLTSPQLTKLKNDSSSNKQNTATDSKLIVYLWLMPLLFLIVLSLIFGVGLRDMWGMPMWSLSGLLFVSLIKPDSLFLLKDKLTKYLRVWLTLVTILMLTYLQFGHNVRNKPSRMDWPEQALSLQAQQTWNEISTCSWDSLSGDGWLSALVAMNANSSQFKTTSAWPSLMISGPESYSPWMTLDRLSKHGTLIMSQDDNGLVLPLVDKLSKESMMHYHGIWQINWPKQPDSEPLTIKWSAYIPNHCVR